MVVCHQAGSSQKAKEFQNRLDTYWKHRGYRQQAKNMLDMYSDSHNIVINGMSVPFRQPPEQVLNIQQNIFILEQAAHFYFIFFNWDSLHAKMISHYESWNYKKKKHKKIKAYRKSVQKEPTVKRCLLILDLKSLRSQVKGKCSLCMEFQSLAVRGKKLLTRHSCNIQKQWQRNGAIYQNNEQSSLENKEVEPVEQVQMNIYQSNTYRKDLSVLHFDDEPGAQERQKLKDQQSCISIFVTQLASPSTNYKHQPRYDNSIPCMAVQQIYRVTEQPQEKETS